MVVGLGDDGSDVIKLRVTWWTQPRDHQMIATYDHVLTAISQTLAESAERRGEQLHAA
jgi:hypothetical protein